MEARIVLVTIDSNEEARQIASQLLEEEIIACANIIPGIQSLYLWQGKIEESSELLLLLKTRTQNLPLLERRVKELHSYNTPEYVVIKPEYIEERYLTWLLSSVKEHD